MLADRTCCCRPRPSTVPTGTSLALPMAVRPRQVGQGEVDMPLPPYMVPISETRRCLLTDLQDLALCLAPSVRGVSRQKRRSRRNRARRNRAAVASCEGKMALQPII